MARPPLPLGTWGKITRTEIAPGRWQALAKYRDYDGRTRKVKRVGTSGAAAERALVAALRDRAKPASTTVDITRDTTVDDLARLWLQKRESEGTLGSGTLGIYRDLIRNHIAPSLGGVRVGEATVGLLDKFIRSVPGATTSRHCRIVLSGMMQLAAQHDAIDRNPVRDTTIRSSERADPKAMTPEMLQRLRVRVASWSGSNRYGPSRGLDFPDLFDVLAGTGVRVGEVLAIRWSDIQWPDGDAPATVSICGTITREAVRQPWPKGKRPRVLILPDFTVAALRRQRARGLLTDQDLVFPSRAGTPRSTHNVRRQLREARQHVVEMNGVPDGPADEFEWVKPHTFRKTVATLLERSGGMEMAAGQLGYSSPEITRAHYVQKADQGPDARYLLNLLAPVVSAPFSSPDEKNGPPESRDRPSDLVFLVGLFSSHANVLRKDRRDLSTVPPRDRSQTPPSSQRRAQPRLSGENTRQVIAAYKAGKTVYELATEYGCHRVTISAVLKRNGVSLRCVSPTPEQAAEMVRLYESGLSLAKVGRQLGFNASTVLAHLRNAGIQTRDAHRQG